MRKRGISVDLIHQTDPGDCLPAPKEKFIQFWSDACFAKEATHYDILHFQLGNSIYHHFQKHFIWLAGSFEKQVKIITTFHDASLAYLFIPGCRFCRFIFGSGAMASRIKQFYWQNSDCIIVHSVAMREYLRRNLKGHKEILILPHIGYAEDYSGPYTKRPRAGFLKILITGALHPSNGQTFIVRALAGIRQDFRAVLMGNGAIAGYGHKVKLLIRKYKLRKKVKIIGRVGESAFTKHFHNADIVVIPRKNLSLETSGMLVHALSAGKPVIVPRDGSFTQYVHDGVAVGYQRCRPTPIRKAIVKLMEDQARNQMIKNIREWAKRRLNNQSLSRQYSELYRSFSSNR